MVNVEHVNPFIKATIYTFETMIHTTIKPGKLHLKDNSHTTHDISGIIGLSGEARGAVSLSFPQECAFDVVSEFVGEPVTELDEHLTDAIGELANIIAGYAKKYLENLDVQISLPSVITGRKHTISDAKDVMAMVIPFEYKEFSFDLAVAMISKK
ncbi:MAG: chemotaxis protein CheX [Fibrobacterales bacterium]